MTHGENRLRYAAHTCIFELVANAHLIGYIDCNESIRAIDMFVMYKAARRNGQSHCGTPLETGSRCAPTGYNHFAEVPTTCTVT